MKRSPSPADKQRRASRDSAAGAHSSGSAVTIPAAPAPALETRVATLEARVQRLEDELAIHRQIVRYGLAVDTGDAAETARLFTEDTVYDVDRSLVMEGRAGVRAMVDGPRHRALLPECAHTIGPELIEIDGDRAVATAYSRIYLHRDGEFRLLRVSCNRFELERRAGSWEIARRTTRLLGSPGAQEIFRRHLHAPFGGPEEPTER